MEKEMERWKATAEIFLKKNIKVYIRDLSDNIYFGDILFVGEDTLTIQCFAPEQRAGEKIVLYWTLINKFEEFRSGV